jgi:hypothetical protein
LKSRKANTPKTTESAPLMNNRTRLAAGAYPACQGELSPLVHSKSA